MELIKITATELRLKTRDLVERVRFKGEHLVVENFGRPMVVMISYEDYMRIQEALGARLQTPGAALPVLASGQAAHKRLRGSKPSARGRNPERTRP